MLSFKIISVEAKNINAACTQNSECNNQAGLVCSAQKCVCPATKFYDGQICSNKRGVNQACSIPNSCNEAIGLSCSKGICSCKSSQQYDGQKCAGIKNFSNLLVEYWLFDRTEANCVLVHIRNRSRFGYEFVRLKNHSCLRYGWRTDTKHLRFDTVPKSILLMFFPWFRNFMIFAL